MFFGKVFIRSKNVLTCEKVLRNSFSDLKRSVYTPCSVQLRGVKTKSDSLTNNNNKERLLEIGLPEKYYNKILSECPEIDTIGVDKIRQSMDSLMKCQFGEEALTELLKRNPYLLCVEPRYIQDIFINLSVRFSKRFVYKIFLNSPEVLNELPNEIIEKVNYLEECMFVSSGQIVNSGVLSHPLEYIKLRHAFLKRVGVFKNIPHKIAPQDKHKINPKISEMLNTPDDEFCKIAGVSIQEYEVFKELFDPESEDPSS